MTRHADALPLVNRRQAVPVLGVSLRLFAALEAEGVITAAHSARGGRPSLYALPKIVPAYVAHVRGAQPAGNDRDARARRDRAQGELLELTIAERRKQLLPRDQVVLEGQSFAKATTAKLRALPHRMAQGGLIPRETEPAVAELIREVLGEIARWSSMLDLLKAQEAAS